MKTRKYIALALAVLTLVSLCACGKSADYSTPAYSASGAYYYEPSEAAYDYEESASGFAASESYSAAAGSTAANSSSGSTAEVQPEKIIYTGSATVETTEFDNTIAALEALVESYGGYVQSSSVSGNNYNASSYGYRNNRYADYTIRIPAERFKEVMGSLSTLGNVPYSSTSSDNISSRYYDTQARMEAYKAQEQSLIAMMEQAETVSDLIAIEDKLSDVRYQIESLQTTLTGWDRKVSYSTINLRISEVTVYTPAEEPTFSERIFDAFCDGISAFVDFLEELVIFFAESWLFLLLLAGVVVLIVKLARRGSADRKAKRAARKAAKAAEKAGTPLPSAEEPKQE